MSNITFSNSNNSIKAHNIVKSLQNHFVDALNNISNTLGEKKIFEEITWLRDEGVHGGGSRYESRDNIIFNTASVNVSQVHYDDMPEKLLRSASAISTIVHPKNPNVPSIHIHISLTILQDQKQYWRLMADLNPSIVNKEDQQQFTNSLKILSKNNFSEAINQGNKYFDIPVLECKRGISHFYLENYNSGNEQNDFEFALKFGEGIIDTYINIITNAIKTRTTFSLKDVKTQLDYHTLYLFQVLTLDKGTTSGLLVHNQNDIGILASLPMFVNKNLLNSWIQKMPEPQDELLKNIIICIKDDGLISQKIKIKIANVIRKHYKTFPNALKYQASGNTITNTVSNHIR